MEVTSSSHGARNLLGSSRTPGNNQIYCCYLSYRISDSFLDQSYTFILKFDFENVCQKTYLYLIMYRALNFFHGNNEHVAILEALYSNFIKFTK
ncbi:hypothetical protein BpHYR1_037000 [Brachionus plicatilis]|uniref:Uncharacterized protein n=1 Tax=Brachionus plicatilis TaxID=10195 RepID=A0A3M7SY31_BRAPC|nr:hypothetical protein BpHYR1_037000 [Brachionus plicatilis]